MKKLKVHEAGRYLMWENGEPFFYLGDTAWELFHKLTKSEIEYYLDVRTAQGFNAVQAVALAEFDGLCAYNAYGRSPLIDCDPARPDLGSGYNYWDHVDFVVDAAADKGIFIVLLPTWGDKINQKWGQGPEIFTPDNARTYGRWIAERYRNRWNIIWMLGGDRPLETQTHRDIVREMGEAIREADGNHLITFHPPGSSSSADFVSGQPYIDFNTVQSGHHVDCYDSWKLVRRTGEVEKKPFMDSEPRYEDHPACFNAAYGYLWDADDVRQNAYWDLMEGVCGHTYGNHSVWKFNTSPEPYWPYHWLDVLKHQGAAQIANIAKLRMSRPYFEFRAAPELLEDDTAVMAHLCAGRGERYAFAYSPLGMPFRIDCGRLGGKVVRASWFDPRTAETSAFAVIPSAEALFVPPTQGKGCDWVLILDVMD